MTSHRLAIVGAGPAGMAAAIAAAESGLVPAVIDESPAPGGQIYRQPPSGLPDHAIAAQTRASARGAILLERFRSLQDQMAVYTETAVWGLFPPRRLAFSRNGKQEMLDAEHLILAQGAYEYVPPFPGWTLPGVITPGAAQLMIKTMHVLPGKNIVVAGTGPFLLVVADQLRRAGAKVVAVVEMARRFEALGALPALLIHIGLFWEGLGYLVRLRRAGIPIYTGHVVVEAKGHEEIAEVIVAPCDAGGYPDRSRAWPVPVDTLCVGYGFVPRTQLAQLAGCRMIFTEEMGGWIPEVDESLRSSIPGVWMAGDGAGVGGAIAAQFEGTLAGLGVARELGTIDQKTFEHKRRPIIRKLVKLNRFGAALARLTRPRPGLQALATKETIVCRCEEVTLEEIEEGMEAGGTDIRTLKVVTRLGMGPCQGLMCWPATARLIAARTGKSIEAVGPVSVRPPLGPVCMGDLAEFQAAEPEA